MTVGRPGFPMGAAVSLDELAGDPHPALARLRAREPVSWLPAMDGWLVTGRAEAIAAMRDSTTFTVDDPRFSTAQVVGPSMLSRDGAEHRRHRAPFVHGESQQQLAAAVRDIASDLVAGVAEAGAAELRTTVAGPLAVRSVCAWLGFEVEPVVALGWYEAIVASVDGVTRGEPLDPAGSAAFGELAATARAAMASPGSLLASVASGGTLTEDEVISNAAVILFGGIVTSEGTNAMALLDLLRHPEQLDAARTDRALVANAVEETMRLEPAAAVVDRYATADAELGGARIAAGDLVRISLSAANRDPATFPDPDRYDVRRPNARQHVAFAVGPHVCIGIHLARLEARALVEAVLDLLPGVELDAARTTPPTGLVFRRPEAVWARWGGTATASRLPTRSRR